MAVHSPTFALADEHLVWWDSRLIAKKVHHDSLQRAGMLAIDADECPMPSLHFYRSQQKNN